jgi:hypothetical protein
MSANGQGPIPQSHQYTGSGPQTQAATYTSNFTTTTQQQTTTTTSNHMNNAYIPAYQQPVSPNLQYTGQPQNLLYQQQAVFQWPHGTQQLMVSQPQQAPVPQQVPPQYQQQSQIVQSHETQKILLPQQSPAPAPQQYQQQQQVVQSSSQPPWITQDLPQHQQQPMLKYPQPQVSSQPPLIDLQQARTIDLGQLVQPPPGPQQSTAKDFSQLMQAAPLANATSSVVSTTTTHSKKTEMYRGANAGGKARKQAESKGDHEVQRFGSKVQKLIKDTGVCPMGRPWYNSFEGYMCGEGIHFLYHKDIDMASKKPGWLPGVTWVNTWDDPEARNSGSFYAMHPPQIAFDQPMHRVHAAFLRTSRIIGCVTGDDGQEKAKLQGCTAKCFRGTGLVSGKELDRMTREQGFDPNATRHAMFN